MRSLKVLAATLMAGALTATAAAAHDPRPAPPPSMILAPPGRPMVRPARNFLANPNFDAVASPGWVDNHHEHPGDGVEGGGGVTAATAWTSWVFTPGPGDVFTEVAPSTLTRGKMIHVKLGGTGFSIYQNPFPKNAGPAKAYGCAWVFVVRGRVGLGMGNEGDTHATAFSRLVGKWERLETGNGVSPANEFVISGEPGSEFFVESAVFSDVWLPNGCQPQ